jgi:hypothetical protein
MCVCICLCVRVYEYRNMCLFFYLYISETVAPVLTKFCMIVEEFPCVISDTPKYV